MLRGAPRSLPPPGAPKVSQEGSAELLSVRVQTWGKAAALAYLPRVLASHLPARLPAYLLAFTLAPAPAALRADDPLAYLEKYEAFDDRNDEEEAPAEDDGAGYEPPPFLERPARTYR